MPRAFRTITALILSAAAVFLVNGCRDEAEEVAEEIPLALDEALIKKTIARLGNGFLVWERSRKGNWEIWVKKLNGGKEMRLVPPQEGHDHFCPKISPDGRVLAYMSYPKGSSPYPKHRGQNGMLWAMHLASRRSHLIAREARSYGEDRAVVWLDNSRLCYIDGQGHTNEFNLETGKTRRLLLQTSEFFGYLVSADLKHATSGVPEFAEYDAEQQTLKHQQRQNGCQPYFTQDSHWGYWMAGAGGPINKMRLATREVQPVLSKDDPRLHGRRNYVYFPMVSPCQRLLAFAASPDNHDHFEADYDIYLAHVHPQTFEIIGNPVRYTKFSGCDRFPDVFRRELPLGSHYVESGTELDFTLGEEHKGQKWHWRVAGTSKLELDGESRTLGHRFDTPGEYWVEARHEEQRVRGYVNVREARPPQVAGVRRSGKEHVEVDFDEPILPDSGSVKLPDGTALRDWQVIDDGYALSIALPQTEPETAKLHLEGFMDRAQKPNRLPHTEVAVPSAHWPATTGGMVFVWEKAKGAARLPDGSPCEVTPQGRAFYDERGAMKLRGGRFDAADHGKVVSEACRKTNAFMVEMIVTPQPSAKDEEMRHIITLSDGKDARNFSIGQRGDDVVLWLRTPANGPSGHKDETHLAMVESLRPHHLLIGYEDDRVIVWVDGSRVLSRNRIGGDFSNWKPMNLHFGADADGSGAWRGLLERVAIYDRILSPGEIAQHANAGTVAIGARPELPQWRVVAKLIEASPTPTLQEFQPYTEALTRHLYQIIESKEGDLAPGTEIAVSHWSWLHGQPLPAQSLRQGDVVELVLHREEAHEELKSLFVKDDLIGGLTADRFHDTTEWDAAGPVLVPQPAAAP